MVNYGRKKCKIYSDKLIKKCFDKANNQIWYCKHCHRHYVFKRKDIHDRLWIYRYIDFLLEKVNLINNRPRKCNNWISPSKLMSEAISECCT